MNVDEKLQQDENQIHALFHKKTSGFLTKENAATKLKDPDNIRLRNLNFNHRKYFKGEKKAKPIPVQENLEKLFDRKVDSGLESDGLTDINLDYIPDSPLIEKISEPGHSTLITPKNIIHLQSDSDLIIEECDRNYDCGPFYHLYNYENRIESDDYEAIIEAIIKDEISGTYPVFERELEYQELKGLVRKRDYILYYLFSKDHMGFFQLKEERLLFYAYPSIAYTSPLRYLDNGSEDELFTQEDDELLQTLDFENMSSMRTLDSNIWH
ncbi:isc10p [Saccharomyces arboricola H-6]|uniref:Isc10p n=1 Tax=Saccharomyces arboricola (strain H-6 / AS 2.3317 / CBS 10644) TaxID=1160507 RepID=J8Q8M4_SACAR|nr:isc10p [Saccharomyces arboricola H-6]